MHINMLKEANRSNAVSEISETMEMLENKLSLWAFENEENLKGILST